MKALAGACDACPPCDGGDALTFYEDADGDGFGNAAVSMNGCLAPSGFVSDATDCDDACAACYPGATEICDGSDNDCNGETDEGTETAFFLDRDGDGYAGDRAGSVSACEAPAPTPGCTGWTSREPTHLGERGDLNDDWDCDDALSEVNPGRASGSIIAIAGAPPEYDFDYNCDGVETKQSEAVEECSPSCTPGWSSVPECGEPGGMCTCHTGFRCYTERCTLTYQSCV